MSSTIANGFLFPRLPLMPMQLCPRNVKEKRAKSTIHIILDRQGLLCVSTFLEQSENHIVDIQ